ncbi:YciI family protein [Rhodococcus aerolatus]
MSQYLLSVVTPTDGTPPSPAELDEIMTRVAALQADQRAAGVWVFSGGLDAPATATTVRPGGGAGDDEVLLVDGPFAEGKEYLGGVTVLDVADLDAALEWGRRSVAAIGLPVEVRPFVGS